VPLSDGLRAAARRGRAIRPPQYPSWLQPEFERRVALHDRWHSSGADGPVRHPSRPDAYASLHSPLWQALFTAYDPERTGAAFEVRHPFLDLRVLRFMLSVPVIPWCRDKYLLRRAMRGTLPAAIVQRRKRGLPATARERTERWLALQPTAPARALKEYVDVAAMVAARLDTRHDVSRVLRVKSLNRWLKDIEEMRV
jgi:asparagine synthase (glutamine-hydrolysing)